MKPFDPEEKLEITTLRLPPWTTLPYPEALRTVGQWLDAQVADDAELTCEPGFITVRWQDVEGGWTVRNFGSDDLQDRSDTARELRTAPGGNPTGEWAICLRALGQELADAEVEVVTVLVESAGFRVSGRRQGIYVNEWHALEGLLDRHQGRQGQRVLDGMRAPEAKKASGWRRLLGLRPPGEQE